MKQALQIAMTTGPIVYRHPAGSVEEERVSGSDSYLSVLERLHRELEPRFYLEIGVRFGASLRLAQSLALGVDPEPELKHVLPPTTSVIAATSDAFFASPPKGLSTDLAFIDGMHLFEFALRDFVNVEACAAPGAVIVIDDVLPNHPSQADRERHTRVWTGDVWRVHAALKRYRPDLQLWLLDTHPTGLLLVANLDGANTEISEHFDAIVADPACGGAVPQEYLTRASALDPRGDEFTRILDEIKARRRR